MEQNLQFSYIYFLKCFQCIKTWIELLSPLLDATFPLFWLGSCYYCMENLQSHLSLHVYKTLCSERGPFLLTNWPFFLWKLSHFLLKASPFMLEIVSTAAGISVTGVQCLSSQWNVKNIEFWVVLHIIMNTSHFPAMQHFLHLVLSPNICFARESNS